MAACPRIATGPGDSLELITASVQCGAFTHHMTLAPRASARADLTTLTRKPDRQARQCRDLGQTLDVAEVGQDREGACVGNAMPQPL